jgi:hypothetical protein
MSKNLDTKIRETKDFGRSELGYTNRHCLDHDRASDGLWTRLDVTVGLWNVLSRVVVFRGDGTRPFDSATAKPRDQ